jgi:hypothetical protein
MRPDLAETDVLTALEAFPELPEWLAGVVAPERVADSLRHAVPQLSGPDVELTHAVVDGLHAEDDEWHVRCRVGLVRNGQPSDLVLVGRLLPPGSAPPPDAPAPPFGEPGWRCHLADLRLLLHVETADAALPALRSLTDPDRAVDILRRGLRNAGYRVDVAGCVPEVVRYKPGDRCTIVYRMQYRGVPGPDPLVVKTHRGDKGRTAWDAMRALWARPLARDGIVTLAEPLAYLPEERVLVQGPVPGERTLKDLARAALTPASPEDSAGSPRTLDELREMLARTAVALAALHGSGARYDRSMPPGEGLASLRELAARLARTVPHVGTAVEPLLDRLEALDASVPADPVVTAHLDFFAAQVLLHDGRVGFIDFDKSCRAEPAPDLGRFRAKLRDTGISAFCASGRPLVAGPQLERHLRLLDELCDDFLTEYQQHAPVTAERVALWESAELLTVLLHAWTRVRPAHVGPRLTLLRHVLSTAPAVAVRSPVP